MTSSKRLLPVCVLGVFLAFPAAAQELPGNCSFPGVRDSLDLSEWGKPVGEGEVVSFTLKEEDWNLGLHVETPRNPAEFYREQVLGPQFLGPGLTGDALQILAAQHDTRLEIVDSPGGLGEIGKIRISGNFWFDVRLVAQYSSIPVSYRLNYDTVEATTLRQWRISGSRVEDRLFLEYFLEGFTDREIHREPDTGDFVFLAEIERVRKLSSQLGEFQGTKMILSGGALWRVSGTDLDQVMRHLRGSNLEFGSGVVLGKGISGLDVSMREFGGELVDSGKLMFPVLAGTGLELGTVCDAEVLRFFTEDRSTILSWGDSEVRGPGLDVSSPFFLARGIGEDVLVLSFSGVLSQ